MRRGHYIVVRYIADLARNEPRNVGVMVWDDAQYRLRIDEDAVSRVVRDHPHLERDALRHIESSVLRQLTPSGEFDPQQIREQLTAQRGYPILFTEPRLTTLEGTPAEALDVSLDRLVRRIVHPRRRGGGGGGGAIQELTRRLFPLVKRTLIHRNYAFPTSRSGLPQAVDFFANSRTNLALDTVRLAVRDADTIRDRSGAEAFKVFDILECNHHVQQFLVYCDFLPDEEYHEANERARRILESVGATVVTDVEDTARTFESQFELTAR